MRTLSQLLTACAFAGVIGAGAVAAVTPAAAQMHDRYGYHQTMRSGSHWRGDRDDWRRGDRDRDGGSNFSLGFYGGYPYYAPYYTGYYGYPYYGYSGYDDCDDYYSSYYDTDECDY